MCTEDGQAMEKLERMCRAEGINFIHKAGRMKNAILYIPKTKTVYYDGVTSSTAVEVMISRLVSHSIVC